MDQQPPPHYDERMHKMVPRLDRRANEEPPWMLLIARITDCPQKNSYPSKGARIPGSLTHVLAIIQPVLVAVSRT